MLTLALGQAHAVEFGDSAEKERSFREQYDAAERAYAAKDYSSAVPRLQAAFAIEPVPQILFNIAQAYRKLYLYSDARVYYELYRSTVKGLSQAEQEVIVRRIDEMRDAERASQSTRVVEKTKLYYVHVQSEKPPPSWLLPVGITSGALGLGGLAGGISLLALNGRCVSPPMGLVTECDQVYNTRLPGALMAVAGGSLTVLGIVFVSLSLRKPTRPVMTETKELPSEDELLPLIGGSANGSREPAPAPSPVHVQVREKSSANHK